MWITIKLVQTKLKTLSWAPVPACEARLLPAAVIKRDVYIYTPDPLVCSTGRLSARLQKREERRRKERRGERGRGALSNLRWAGRSVVHGGRASLLLHKDSFPLLPAARRLGRLSLRRLLSSRRLGQLPLLPIVIGCGRTADVENNTPKTNLSYSSRAIIHSAAQSRALISVPFIAVVQEVMRLITDTHCIWFWSERSSSPSTCRWRGRGWRGSSSTAASRTPSCRSPGSGRRGGRSGWWSDRFSLCTWKQRKEGAGRDVETMSASDYTFIYDN